MTILKATSPKPTYDPFEVVKPPSLHFSGASIVAKAGEIMAKKRRMCTASSPAPTDDQTDQTPPSK